MESWLSVDARERYQLVRGRERERGWVRLYLGARGKRSLVKECEREGSGAVHWLGRDSTRGSRLIC
jgi:hypothetical protein